MSLEITQPKAKDEKKYVSWIPLSAITKKCNTEQTLVYSSQASFPLVQTKTKQNLWNLILLNTACRVRILC